IHGLRDREREWLEYASLLHDIGNHISYERHHRHSYYLIKNGDLRGFEPDEIEVIALLARYHRRAMPDRRHLGYRRLPRELRRAVRTMSVFLRLAETLDRSRNGVVTKVEVRERAGKLRLDVFAVGDAELEVWAANKQLPALDAVLERSANIVAHHVQEPDEAPRSKRRAARATPVKKPMATRARATQPSVH
ncbi:MAG: HD domain-containing protein, partial [Vicinamibacterales bacterium]